MKGRQAVGAGVVAALTAGTAWFGIDAATAGSEQGVRGSDRLEFRGWQGKPVDSVAQAQRMAGGGRTLALVAETERARGVDVGAKGESTGDFFIFEETLYNSRQSRVVGEDTIRCELGIRTFTCEGTIKVNKRGKIRVAGALFAPRDLVIPITGGTKDFRGVGGELEVFDLRGGRALLLFDLVR